MLALPPHKETWIEEQERICFENYIKECQLIEDFWDSLLKKYLWG